MPQDVADRTLPLVVLMPVYNDWPVVPLLLERLDRALAGAGLAADVVLVDDGSPEPPGRDLLAGAAYRALASVSVLRLTRNLGHQRAIAIGLAYVHAKRPCRGIVVMDADGEDAAEDVPRLVQAGAAGGERLVFAARTRRSEGPAFQAFYRLYRLLHRVLTGAWISFGNFSYVPRGVLPRLVVLSELWSHYPAAVMKARLPVATIPVERAARLAGQSQMNLVSLVLHGLASLSVHGDVIGIRALLATLVAIVLCLAGIGTVVGIRIFTELAIPGWASFVTAVLVVILLQTVSLSLVFVFMILTSRNYATVLPRRDYADYVDGEEPLHP